MQVKTFIGGIHTFDAKITQEQPIEIMPIPKLVVIPLLQHAGTPAKPIVEPKMKVKAGTKIGELSGQISANIHSSIAGTVKSIEPRFSPEGIKTPSVIIESDGTDNIESYKDEVNSPQEIIERVKEAGIVGLGGGAFPTYVKLTPPKNKTIKTVILNGCECEPCLSGDYRLMIEKTREILEGGRIIMNVVSAKKGYISIEINKIQAIEKMKIVAKEFGFEVFVLKAKYPQGSEKQLIYAITGKEIPAGKLPFDIGLLVHNVGTAYSVYEACKSRKPLIERAITVAGRVKTPKNLVVRIGTLLKDIIEFCGGYVGEPEKIIMGGPMMGIAQADDEVPVIKATTGILVQNKQDLSLPYDYPCIRCGACVSACSMNLLPSKIGDYIETRKFNKAKEIGILDCIECGCCSFVCPSKRNLTHLIKYGKLIIDKELSTVVIE